MVRPHWARTSAEHWEEVNQTGQLVPSRSVGSRSLYTCTCVRPRKAAGRQLLGEVWSVQLGFTASPKPQPAPNWQLIVEKKKKNSQNEDVKFERLTQVDDNEPLTAS